MHKTQREAPVVSAEEHQWVRAFTPGIVVRDVYAVDNASKKEARNGPFWALELKDATGSVSARIWSPLSQQFDDIPGGSLVAVEAKTERYREQIQLSIINLRVLDADEMAGVDTSIFMPASARSPLLMLEELEDMAAEVLTHQPWAVFIRRVLRDETVRTRLLKAPAARGIHHARAGGLLEHILGVTRLCLHFAELYPQLDRQALFAGAVCHDLGKLWELTSGLSLDYTDEGRLAGHIFLGIEHLLPHMEAAGLGPDQRLHLQHLILSHHGQYEYGSPRLPQTAEAIALHYADNMDAKMDQCRTLFSEMDPEAGAWSPYQKSLERAIYRAPRTPNNDRLHAEPDGIVVPAQEQKQEHELELGEPALLTEPEEICGNSATYADGFLGLAELAEMEVRQAQENGVFQPLTAPEDLSDVPDDFMPKVFSDTDCPAADCPENDCPESDYPEDILQPGDEECVFEHLTDTEEIEAVLSREEETSHFVPDSAPFNENLPPATSPELSPEPSPEPSPELSPTTPPPAEPAAPQAAQGKTRRQDKPREQEKARTEEKTRVEVRQCSLL